jgi:RNA polymerase primary sigma factor
MAKSHITLHQTITTVNNREIYELYLRDIKHYDKLTKDEEFEYFRQLRAGNTKLYDELISRNLLFVIAVAKQFQAMAKGALTLEDLIAEGNVGLCLAINRFDHTKGFKFISYAVFWIKQCILASIKDNIKAIRIPSNRQGILTKINKLEREMEQEMDYDIDYTQLAYAAVDKGIMKEKNAVSELGHLKKDSAYCSSLSALMGNSGTGEELTLLDVIADENSEAPDAKMNIEDYRVGIYKMLNTLPNNIRGMIELYYGIDTYKPLTYNEIGIVYDLTSERIRQIIQKHLRRLARNFKDQELEINNSI